MKKITQIALVTAMITTIVLMIKNEVENSSKPGKALTPEDKVMNEKRIQPNNKVQSYDHKIADDNWLYLTVSHNQ